MSKPHFCKYLIKTQHQVDDDKNMMDIKKIIVFVWFFKC